MLRVIDTEIETVRRAFDDLTKSKAEAFLEPSIDHVAAYLIGAKRHDLALQLWKAERLRPGNFETMMR